MKLKKCQYLKIPIKRKRQAPTKNQPQRRSHKPHKNNIPTNSGYEINFRGSQIFFVTKNSKPYKRKNNRNIERCKNNQRTNNTKYPMYIHSKERPNQNHKRRQCKQQRQHNIVSFALYTFFALANSY